MRTFAARASVVLALTASACAHAQTANPVLTSAREIYDQKSKNIVAAAEEMPAEKYGYKPTPGQWTFGKTIAHVVDGNSRVCAMIGGTPATAIPAVKDTDSKEALVAALKASFDFCSKSLDATSDSKLGDPITFFGNRKTVRARALLELTIDVTDHYTQMAGYLRLNDLLPPSAQPKK
jgi:uncharacterized damage-inducible protein DinB